MSDLAARLALLAKETSEFENGHRILSGRDRFADIIRLIDQTVIPAQLHIEDDDGAILLEVSGRRLCRMPGEVEDLTSDDADAIASVAALILAFADRAKTKLRVRELPSSQGDVDPTQSVSITALANAANRTLIDASAPPLDQFKARLGDLLVADLTLENGETTDRNGDDEHLKVLDDMLNGLTPLASDAPCITIFEVGDVIYAAAHVGKEALVFSAQTNDIGALISDFDQSAGLN